MNENVKAQIVRQLGKAVASMLRRGVVHVTGTPVDARLWAPDGAQIYVSSMTVEGVVDTLEVKDGSGQCYNITLHNGVTLCCDLGRNNRAIAATPVRDGDWADILSKIDTIPSL